MKFKEDVTRDLLMYAITDRLWLDGRPLADDVRLALEGGATMLQLREKELSDDNFLSEAQSIKRLCREFRVPFIINDNVDVALACDADGIHVGQKDMAAGDVRAMIGPDRILGVSAQTVEQAKAAELQGADYLGVGAVFPTGTKQDADAVSKETLTAICQSVSIPVVAIGGITLDNAGDLSGSGIAGIAVVSAVFAADDITGATRSLVRAAREATHG